MDITFQEVVCVLHSLLNKIQTMRKVLGDLVQGVCHIEEHITKKTVTHEEAPFEIVSTISTTSSTWSPIFIWMHLIVTLGALAIALASLSISVTESSSMETITEPFC
jgi:hypothetical protein